MKRPSFKLQIIFGLALIVIGNTLAFVFHNGVFSNIAWIIYGLLFVVNPSYPERFKYGGNERKAKICVRIVGILCIIIGLITRFVV